MTVEKYRSAEEMNAAPAAPRGDEGFERFLRHCARWRRLAPRAFPRGVFKFASVEEAQQAREQVGLEVERGTGSDAPATSPPGLG